jgi:hypothetical protein
MDHWAIAFHVEDICLQMVQKDKTLIPLPICRVPGWQANGRETFSLAGLENASGWTEHSPLQHHPRSITVMIRHRRTVLGFKHAS